MACRSVLSSKVVCGVTPVSQSECLGTKEGAYAVEDEILKAAISKYGKNVSDPA